MAEAGYAEVDGAAYARLRKTFCGLTFKENTPDIRNSQVVDIIGFLNERDVECSVFDPDGNQGEPTHPG